MLGPKFLVLSGDGINCEFETQNALKNSGAIPEVVHINDLLKRPCLLSNYQGMALPGGFSFGDELGSGQVLSLKIKHKLKDHFNEFVHRGGAIIGICNGFQVLLKLGLLPDYQQEKKLTLAHNDSGRFINKWVKLDINPNTVCKWTLDLEDISINLPVRHGEGRIVLKSGMEEKIYGELQEKEQIVFKYRENINGSYQQIAGICDPTGHILGLMPHPEAYQYEGLNYQHNKNEFFTKGKGQLIFDSITNYLKQA